MRRLILLYIVATLVFGLMITLLLMNGFSDKKKLREEGIAAFGKGDYSAAESAFLLSLDENQWFTKNMDLDTRMYLGACYLRQNRYNEAVDCYRQIEDDNNGSVNEELIGSMKDTANAMSEMEDFREFPPDDTKIEQMLQVAEKQPYIYLCIASVYNDRGDYENAIKNLESYQAVRGINTYVAYELSASYIRQGDTAKATDMIDKGLSASDTSYTDLLKYNQAVLKEMSGDLEGAFSMMEQLHQQYPDNAQMQKEYDFLYTRLNIDETPVNPYTDVMTEEEIARAKQKAAEEAATAEEADESTDESQGDSGNEAQDEVSDEGQSDSGNETQDETTDEGQYDGSEEQ